MEGINHTITDPKGVDAPVQKAQKFLFDQLKWANSEFYGRLFVLETENGYVPRGFVSGIDYKDVFTDDRKSAKVFFLVGDDIPTKSGLVFTAPVKIVVMAKLDAILTNNVNRADTDLQEQVIKVLQRQKYISVTGIQTKVKRIFEGFAVDDLKIVDYQPYHVFAIRGNITYQFNC